MVGTVEKYVIPRLLRYWPSSSPKRGASAVGTTSVEPLEKAIQISSTEPSKLSEKPW